MSRPQDAWRPKCGSSGCEERLHSPFATSQNTRLFGGFKDSRESTISSTENTFALDGRHGVSQTYGYHIQPTFPPPTYDQNTYINPFPPFFPPPTSNYPAQPHANIPLGTSALGHPESPYDPNPQRHVNGPWSSYGLYAYYQPTITAQFEPNRSDIGAMGMQEQKGSDSKKDERREDTKRDRPKKSCCLSDISEGGE